MTKASFSDNRTILKPKDIYPYFYMDGHLRSNLEIIRQQILTKDMDMVGIVDGFEGCLAGDTLIDINYINKHENIPIRTLFNLFKKHPKEARNNYIRCFNGQGFCFNKILKVLYSGKKPLYQLKTDGGHTIKATASHKFLTKSGWKPLSSLDINGGLFTISDGYPANTSKIISKKYIGVDDTYDIQCEEPYHNFVANGIVVHNSGKSVMAMQIAKYIDPTLCLDRICFTPDEFREQVLKGKPGQAVVYDEAITGAYNREAIQFINVLLIKLMTQIRQKNLFILFVLPSFFDLDKNIAVWRSKFLIHCYFGVNFQRGFFGFANMAHKKRIYIEGKKMYHYNWKYWNFRGRFTKHMAINEKKYREKKAKSLTDGTYDVDSISKVRSQRDSLILVLEKMGYSKVDIAKYSDIMERGMTSAQVGNIVLKYEKIKKEIGINKLKSILEVVKLSKCGST